MVASEGTILIAPDDGDMRAYLDQLERLAALGARVALPAHGQPIDAPAEVFRRYVRHRLMRESKILSAVAKRGAAGATAQELLPDAYSDVPAATWPLALLSAMAHLEKLVADGRVRTAAGARYIAEG
jgi:hypothetical protein